MDCGRFAQSGLAYLLAFNLTRVAESDISR